jgi:hypothetical protein
MSLYPAFLSTRKRKQEQAAPLEPPPELENDPDALPVFELVPPEKAETEQPLTMEEPLAAEERPPQGRNVHTIGIHDLTRLSIDNDGRLYWDGKPVEVSRRILMSRKQVLGATVIAVFVVIGALGAAIQGAAAARDWACRLGWTTQYCAPSPNSSNIPA